MNISDYDRLMTVLDPTFTKQEIELAFSFFDRSGNKNVTLQDFVDYFTSVTGQIPVQNNGYQKKDSNSSDASFTFPSFLNSFPIVEFLCA